MKQIMEADSRIPIHTALGVSLLACFIMFRYMLGSIDIFFLMGIVLILMLSRKLRMSFDKSDYFWVLYVVILFSLGIIRDDMGTTIKRTLTFLALIMLKLLLQADHSRWSKWFLNLLFVFGFIHSASIVIEVITPNIIRAIKRILNVSELEHRAAYLNGITSQPAIVGFCISVFTCICVIGFFRTEEKRVKPLLLSVLGVSTLLLTGKRALFVEVLFCCFVVAYLYFAVIMKKGFRLFTVILVVVLLIPFVTRLPVFSRNIDRLLNGDDAGRYLIWQVLINNFKSSPIIGVGRNVYYSQMNIGAHNDYLRVLSENGLVGFTFCFLALMIPLLQMLRFIFFNRNAIRMMLFKEVKYLIFELLVSIFWQILILLYALTGNPLNSIEQLASYMAFTAMGVSAKRELELVIVEVDNI